MSTPSTQTLLEQYRVAVDLYTHEDNLNWRKLNNLFYVTAGLLLAIGFILEQSSTSANLPMPPRCMLGILSLFGILVCFTFTIALWSGVRYLHDRKDKVMSIERALIDTAGGQPVVSATPKQKTIFRAPTAWVLRLTPFLLALMWAAILATCFVRTGP